MSKNRAKFARSLRRSTKRSNRAEPDIQTWVGSQLDIETENWETFVLGVLVDEHGQVHRSDAGEDEFFDLIIKTKGFVWSHNGGLFDFLWVAQKCKERKIKATLHMAGTRIVRMTVGKTTFRDSLALIPMSLKKAATIADIELTKDTGLRCRCGQSCGGYCRINREMNAKDREKVFKYCEIDALALRSTLTRVKTEFDACQYVTKGTIGGTSYASASAYLGIRDADWDPAIFEMARRGYFGGRTEVYAPRSDHGFGYDVNSAYPAALTNLELPTGQMIVNKRCESAFASGKEGIFYAHVNVPDTMFIPPLPLKIGLRVAFPIGRFEGYFTALELREAIDLGCDVSIEAGVYWMQKRRVFRDFMRRGFDFRDKAKEKNPMLGALHKWFLNSCTGKLAESPEKEHGVICPDELDIEETWRPLDNEGCVWAVPHYRIGPSAHVHWAAYLTAWARITLARQLRNDGHDGRLAVYADTDSCYSESPRESSNDLGGWKFEAEYTDFLALAPKAYRYRKDGDWVIRCKGVPGITRDEFAAFIRGETLVRERGVMGFKSAAKKGKLFAKKRVTRSNLSDGSWYGSRKMGADGKTYPVTQKELEHGMVTRAKVARQAAKTKR